MRKTLLAAMAATCLVTFHPTPSQAMNCVAYVRSVTGFDISGNAYQWWNAATGVYARGHQPEAGAVMVFARTRGMRDGHVAVVRSVRSSREILIDQANWVQGPHGGAVTKATSVIDVSPNNDWTQVRVEWVRSGSYGRVNPVNGFIYADGDSRGAVVSARYLQSKSQAVVAQEECLTPPPAIHPQSTAHGVSAQHHAQPHVTTAALHLGDNKHHGHVVSAVAKLGDNKHHGGVQLASMHLGDAQHHGIVSAKPVTAAVDTAAAHAKMVKLRHTVLVYNNKAANKVMAEQNHPSHLVHVAAKTVVPAPKHVAQAHATAAHTTVAHVAHTHVAHPAKTQVAAKKPVHVAPAHNHAPEQTASAKAN